MSTKLRNQILFSIDDWDNRFRSYGEPSPIYDALVEIMRTELGRTSLINGYSSNVRDEFGSWFRSEETLDWLLDGVEIAAKISGMLARNAGSLQKFEDEISALNARMLEDSFGYQIEGGQIIQISSTFTHKAIVVPALELLSDARFSVVNSEFRQAFSEFNQGHYDDCIHDCCNAFESTLKTILTENSWPFDPDKDSASKLLAIVFDKQLIPSYMQGEFTGLRTILESGVPTLRNRAGGHGAGSSARVIPKHIAAFQLHQTAAAIVLLVDAFNA